MSFSAIKRIIQSPYDKRLYRSVLLPNKLQCLLISDKETDKSAAALDVKIGQFADPKGVDGLAHFLEHMLFLGTEKYPHQNDYSEYLNKNAGYSNAYTSHMRTNYHFEVANPAFKGALDRFSQFFIKPLFTESLTDREMNAVNSEHEKNLNSDMWRLYQLQRSTSKPNTPYARFGTGSLPTLQVPNIREHLLKFYDDYYSANVMKLVMYGREDLDQLENWAQEMFAAIQNKDRVSPRFTELPFDSTNMGTFWEVVPVKNKDTLEFFWVLENMKPHYKSDPLKYISHLFGHEGQNSLTKALIDQGLAREVSSGHENEMELYSVFELRIELTKEGLRRQQEVIEQVFAYLKMLKETPPQKWLFDEIKREKELKFLFRDKASAISETTSIAANMNEYPVEEALVLPYLFDEFDGEKIQRTINSFHTDNLRIILSSKDFENKTEHTEKWYGTQYNTRPFDETLKRKFKEPQQHPEHKLGLPPQNPFFPKKLDILQKKTEEPKYPVKILENENTTIWYKCDDTFEKPKAGVFANIYAKHVLADGVTERLYEKVWLELFDNYLRELKYMASLANLHLQISVGNQGVEVNVQGFNDSIDALFKEFIVKLKSFTPQEDKFHLSLEKIRLIYENNFKNQPYSQLLHLQRVVMLNDFHYTNEEFLSRIPNLSFKAFTEYYQKWLHKVRYEWLAVGNIDAKMLENIAAHFQSGMKEFRQAAEILPKDQIQEVRVVNLPEELRWIAELPLKLDSELNSAIVSYFQIGEGGVDNRTRVLTALLSNYLHEKTYNQLRTNEQLGYITSSGSSNLRGVLGFYVLVQSNVAGPVHLSSRIDAFVNSQLDSIDNLTNEEFKDNVESVATEISQKFLSIYEEAGFYWREIDSHRYQFDRKHKMVEALRKISKEDFIRFTKETLGSKAKRIEFHAISKQHSSENKKRKDDQLKAASNIRVVVSPEWFKKRMPLFPDFNAHL